MSNFSTDGCRNPQKMPNYSFGIFQFLAKFLKIIVWNQNRCCWLGSVYIFHLNFFSKKFNLKNWKIWPTFRHKFLCDTVRVYQNPANMNPFWHFSFVNWFHFQIISSLMATRRYLDQVTKKHLQTHKVQYFQPIGLENYQIEWPPKQNLHYLHGV